MIRNFEKSMTRYFPREAIILGAGIVLLFLNWFSPLFEEPMLFVLSTLFYLFVIPIAIISLYGGNLRDFGFRKEWHWPFSRRITVLTGLFVLSLLVLASLLPQFNNYYTARLPASSGWRAFFITVVFGLYLFAWEFFFRGFLLFGLVPRFGVYAIVIHLVLFTGMHITKPPLELVASLPGGLLLECVAYRCRSFLPAFLIHWMMNVVLKVLIVI
ncbi:hypothetical protein COU79_04235 [Candidatus Peregrinibacteria bacterium CG10_big_fil_rev_8_21_14_0_10_54_7]|nr:MAG: hypothetical protein COU79_04235 [Candidatus Peregrinibacteria bacterium CG10_big_fil_rev_8_21_14_0_10_54_7]